MTIILRDDDIRAFDAKAFSFHPEDGWFVAEASDVGFRQCFQIYDDACDEGIALRGCRSTVRYYLSEVKRNPDGDVQVWIFKPISEDARRIPRCSGTQVHILND
jgi:hypothetical protein